MNAREFFRAERKTILVLGPYPVAKVREMRGKNIACVRALMNVAFNEGDRLGTAWGPILVCVSALARLLKKRGDLADVAGIAFS